MSNIPDPYHALELPHTANAAQIKTAYRNLARKYHPDRLTLKSIDEQQRGTIRFAQISQAYALLNDPVRKQRYDHVYRYGGFDKPAGSNKKIDDNDKENSRRGANTKPTSSTSQKPFTGASTPASSSPTSSNAQSHDVSTRKRKQQQQQQTSGIGYKYYDPLAFIWTNGKVSATTTVAGVDIPSRLEMARAMASSSGGGGSNSIGIKFAISSGQQYTFDAKTNTRRYVSRTTQYSVGDGKKYCRTETTIVHPDGRRDIVIEEGEDGNNNSCTTTTITPPLKSRKRQQKEFMSMSDNKGQVPWYMNAWHGFKNSLHMCYSPCAVAAQ